MTQPKDWRFGKHIMAEDRVERRLAAILAADVAGYSRLMGADEEGTLAALKAHRRAVLDPKITEHRGRIVKTIGRPVRTHRVRIDSPVDEPSAAAVATTRSAQPLPQKPSIAVLPFANMSGDAEQEYFSEGITEDIITNLSHNHAFFVISRSTSFAFKGPAVDVGNIDIGRAHV